MLTSQLQHEHERVKQDIMNEKNSKAVTTINASKESARKALDNLNSLTAMMPQQLPQLLYLKDFIAACERKLPTEASYDRERQRKRAYSRKKSAAKREEVAQQVYVPVGGGEEGNT